MDSFSFMVHTRNTEVTMRLTIRLKWIEPLNRWDIIKENGFTMYDIPACENVDMIFDHPSKEKDEVYEIEIRRKT